MRELILIVICLVIFFFGISIYYLKKDREALKKEKLLKKFIDGGSDQAVGEDLLKHESLRSGLEKLVGRFMDLAALEQLIISADVSISLERFLILSFGVGFVFIIPIMIIFRSPPAILLGLVAGIFLPFLYLIYRKKRREENLIEQLPDALDMIVRALKVGQSVDGALQEVARGFSPPIGAEIKTVYDEMSMGLSFEIALRHFEERFPGLSDVKILCTAFIVQRETGGNLTSILEGVAKTIRERFQLKRQIKVLTAEGRMSAMILGLLPVAFAAVAYVFNPEYIGLLFHDPLGKKLLLLAIVFEAAGFGIMRIMSRIKI